MKKLIYLSFVLIFFVGCNKNKSNEDNSFYERNSILIELEDVLNESIPDYQKIVEGGFSHFKDGVPVGYFVQDLVDLENRTKITPEDTINDIEFKENHIYHFSPTLKFMSISNFAYLSKDHIKVFYSINCENKGDDINTVLEFFKGKPNINDNIISNIKNYRNYGNYIVEDNYGITVDCD